MSGLNSEVGESVTQLNSDLKWIDITSNITFASALNWATKKAFYNKATKEVWIEGQVSSNGLDYDSAIINISNYPPNRNFLTAGSSNRYYMPGYAMARFSPSISSTTSTNYFSVTLQLTSNNEVKVMYPSTTTAYAHKFSIRYITTV